MKKMEMDFQEPINMSVFNITTEKEILVCLFTDGFVLVLFRIKLISNMREIKNNVKKPVNCRDYENLGLNK